MIIKDEHRQIFLELFHIIYKGNVHASDVSIAFIEVLHVWDDLIDKDRELSDQEINTAFLNATVTLAASPLWGPDMANHMVNIYLKWQDANVLEHDPQATDDDIAKAWMLRASFYDIFVLLAGKLYGLEWANEVGPLVRRTYGETLADFKEEVRNG